MVSGSALFLQAPRHSDINSVTLSDTLYISSSQGAPFVAVSFPSSVKLPSPRITAGNTTASTGRVVVLVITTYRMNNQILPQSQRAFNQQAGEIAGECCRKTPEPSVPGEVYHKPED